MGSGNPLKRIVREAERIGGQISSEAGRVGEQATQAATSIGASVADPGTWLSYAVNPTVGLGLGSKKAQETYQAMSQAERDKADAEAAQALATQTEAAAKAEQEKMITDKAKAAADQAKERAARLGQGRRGLLYQGQAAGVTKSNVLGG